MTLVNADANAEKEAKGDRAQTSDLNKIFERHGVVKKGKNKLEWDTSTPGFPRNWSRRRKIYAVVVISWLELYMTAISSSGASTADEARLEYSYGKTLAYFAFLTIYLLGQTLGSIFCSPISEAFGRRTIYVIANIVFCIASIIVGSIHSVIAVYFGRFVQGVAAAIPATVCFGSFNDLYDAYDRIWIVYAYTLSGLIGLAAGPIFSAYVTEYAGWRWVYYIATIVAGVSAIASAFIAESNAAQLLDARVAAVNAEIGKNDFEAEGGSPHSSIADFAQQAAFRPLTFLVTEPIVFFCAALCSIAFGLVYGLTEALSLVYTAEPFNFSTTSASLSFVAILIGEVINIIPRFYDDRLLKRLRAQKKRVLPEHKIRSFAIACPALAIGLWIFGSTIPPKVTAVPWPVSMIGLVCIGFAANDFSYTLFGYATDSYGDLASSAVAAISLTRTLAAAVFPLFTTQQFNGLGNNVATWLLAAIATAFAFTPILFLRYGAKLRQHSKNSPDGEECMPEENKHMRETDDARDQTSERVTQSNTSSQETLTNDIPVRRMFRAEFGRV